MKKVSIVAVVGESGSGKTYAVQYLGQDERFNAIVSYTTREQRPNEVNGVDHWFVSDGDVPPQAELSAYTMFGGKQYWTTWNQFSDSSVCHLYVIDENGVDFLRERVASAPFDVQLLFVRVRRADLSSIEANRRSRDKDRFVLDDSAFDYVLRNEGSLEEFRQHIDVMKDWILKQFDF